MRKVLIITYYWPPSGGPGVQRVLKFSKYLPEFGWQPIILTVKNGEYPAIDETLAEDIPECCKVFKTNSIEPNLLYKKFTGMKPDENLPVAVLAEKDVNWKKRWANWIRLNLFIPDAKIGWIPFAVREGKKIIEREKPELIFSSSPPPTVHLIAQKLATWSGVKWVADFRDPWTDIYHYDRAVRSLYSRSRDRRLERGVLNAADVLTTVSRNVSSLLEAKKGSGTTIEVIPNGYDEADFRDLDRVKRFNGFTLTYAGKMNNQQNPTRLWEVLNNLVRSDQQFAENFQMLFMGNITSEIMDAIEANNLRDNLKIAGYVNHNRMIENLYKSHILLLLIPNTKNNQGIVTGKLFEYLPTENFILGVGPENGDAAKILHETNTGKMFGFEEIEEVGNEIERQYGNWQKGIRREVNEEEIREYSRRKSVDKLAEIFGYSR
ncbi:glycosyltransferase [bacterium]|nr:glycosyltransferase [bacterium]